MDNRIKLSKNDINELLDIIKSKNNKSIIFIPRDYDTSKNPREFMVKLGIDYNDAIECIKDLTIDNYIECILDTKKDYKYLYVFKTFISDTKTYIKIGFFLDMKDGLVHVVSFHEDME